MILASGVLRTVQNLLVCAKFFSDVGDLSSSQLLDVCCPKTFFCPLPSDSGLSLVSMTGCTLNEALCIKHLIGAKFNPDLKWNSYIWSIAKNDREIVYSFYHSSKYPTPPDMLNLYKTSDEIKIDYCCQIYARGVQYVLSGFDRV